MDSEACRKDDFERVVARGNCLWNPEVQLIETYLSRHKSHEKRMHRLGIEIHIDLAEGYRSSVLRHDRQWGVWSCRAIWNRRIRLRQGCRIKDYSLAGYRGISTGNQRVIRPMLHDADEIRRKKTGPRQHSA